MEKGIKRRRDTLRNGDVAEHLQHNPRDRAMFRIVQVNTKLLARFMGGNANG